MRRKPARLAPTRRGVLCALLVAAAAPAALARRQFRPEDDDDVDAPSAWRRDQPAAAGNPDDGQPGDVVKFASPYPMGAIVIVNDERRLYYVLGADRAIRYPIAIGTEDEIWTGRSFVQSKVKDPVWKPPWNPGEVIQAGPENPLGERAIYLDWSLYRIHGTNAPGSIGHSASHGCFRMHNKHVKDLYNRVHIGAPVYVVDALDDPPPPRREDKPPSE
jgi:lipoprotein-anchoring transpeptidase ErfK/SrfK